MIDYLILGACVVRKKKSTNNVEQFPGFDLLHKYLDNLNKTNQYYGYIGVTVDANFVVKYSHNYENAPKNEKIFIINQLNLLAAEIAKDPNA